MRLHSLFDGQSEVYFGYPDLRGNDQRKTQRVLGQEMILWNHKKQDGDGEPYRSQLLNIMEFYGGTSIEPQIHSATYLEVDGDDEFNFAPLGCEIVLEDRRGYFIFSASQQPKTMRLPNGRIMSLHGRIGHAAFNADNQLIHLELIAGTQLSCAGKTVDGMPAIAGEITAANADANTIEVTAQTPIPNFISEGYLTRKEINLRRGLFEQTYQIDEARIAADRMRITMKLHLPIISVKSRIAAIKPDRVELESVFIDFNTSVHGSRLRGVSGAMYVADNKAGHHTPELIFFPKAQPQPFTQATLQQEFRVGDTVSLYDYWIGDKISIPITSSLAQHKYVHDDNSTK
jgi:hypothetical protein